MDLRCIEINDLPYDESKDKILQYFKTHDGKVYVTDILRDLHIHPDVIMDVMDELEDDGIIGNKKKSK